jgi:glycosyltransferase involved in cell wall biosynthesis
MKVAIVVPCFNEAASLPELLVSVLRIMGPNDFLLFVDDGSTDDTIVCLFHFRWRRPDRIEVISDGRNEGQQAALLKGLLAVRGKCDCAITMDADGQHDPRAIPTFIEKYQEGADIVYGVRRRNLSLVSRLFYRLMGKSLIPNHADYRLISARVLDTLTSESEPFLRGLFANTKFKTATVEYDEQSRIAGRSTYTFRKRLALFASALRWYFRLTFG